MKLNMKKSMMLISLLCILIISIGMVSASANIDNDYQSDSIDNAIDINDNSNNGMEETSIISDDSSTLLNKEKTILSDDGDGEGDGDDGEDEGAENGDDEGDGGDDDPTDDIFVYYTISEPENGTTFVEGEDIQINISLLDENEDPVEKEVILNLFEYNSEDGGIDEYYNVTINGNYSFNITKYLHPSEYVLYIGEYDEEDGILIMEGLSWPDESTQDMEFVVTTNYNKEVYANLTVGYNIEELENLVEGDSITAYISLMDEFDNLMNETVYLALYKNGEDDPVNTANVNVIDGKNANPTTFDELEAGDYSLVIENIIKTPNYTNVITSPINFTVKSNYNEYDYSIVLDEEGNEGFVGDSYSLGIQIRDPQYEQVEGDLDLYVNGEYVSTLNISYDDDLTYSYHIIEGLDLGINNITLVYNVTDDVNVSTSANFIRYEYQPRINIDAPDIVTGDDAIINVNLTYSENQDEYIEKILNESFDVTVEIYYDDDYEGEYEDFYEEYTFKGSGEINISDLNIGTYIVSVKYDGKEYEFLPKSEEAYFEVVDKYTDIYGYIDTISTEDDAIVNIRLRDYTGNPISDLVSLVLDGDESKVYTVNTTTYMYDLAEVNLGKLSYGIHNITLSYDGNEEEGWHPCSTLEKFMVLYPSFIGVETNDVLSGSDLTLNVSLTSVNDMKINETVYILIKNSKGDHIINNEYNLTNGKTSIELENITEDYIVYVSYESGCVYIEDFDPNKTYFVSSEKYESIRVLNQTEDGESLAALELTRLDNNNVLVSLKDSDSKPIANANLKLNLNGAESNIKTDKDGSYKIKVDGNSTIKVTYVDPNGNGILTSNMEIIIINTTNVIENNNTEYVDVYINPNGTIKLTKDGSNVIATLTDSNGKAIANAQLSVNINGQDTKMTTDKSGKASIPISGNATIAVSYKDSNNLTVSSSINIINTTEIKEVEKTVFVNQSGEVVEVEKIVYINQTVEVPVEVEKIVYVNQTTEVPISTEKIVYINQTVEVPVEVEKTIYINQTIEKNNTVYVTPNRTATKIEYKNMVTTAVAKADGRVGEYFYVRLTDDKGKALADKPIKIGFNGVVYNRTTDANGSAKLQINLGYKGIYTFAIGFLGDDNYTGAFEVASITVNLQKPQLTTSSKTYKASAKTKSLTATFKTVKGNPVSGKKISFTVNGKTYSATTNSKGVATVKVSLSKKGTYSFTAKYAGDNQFATISKSAKLTIK